MKKCDNTHLLLEFWRKKRVVITGGTAGLGAGLARALMRLEAQIVVVGRNPERLNSWSQADRKRVHFVQADVADKESIYKISGETLGILGGLDVLINNASYLGESPLKPLVDSDCEDLELALQTNLLAPFRLTKAFLPSMLLKRSGLIVNISSDAAQSAYPNWGGYSASKAALDHLSRIWSSELAERGVRILALDPGDMATEMHFQAIPSADPATLYDPMQVAQSLVEFLPQAYSANQARLSASEWRDLSQRGVEIQ